LQNRYGTGLQQKKIYENKKDWLIFHKIAVLIKLPNEKPEIK